MYALEALHGKRHNGCDEREGARMFPREKEGDQPVNSYGPERRAAVLEGKLRQVQGCEPPSQSHGQRDAKQEEAGESSSLR